MKKKLNITQLKVKSFVTSAEPQKVFGGGTYDVKCRLERSYTCYDHISCEPLMCVVASEGDRCIKDITRH